MRRLSIRVQERLSWTLMIVAVVVYCLEMGHQSVLRYDTFKATAFDLGNMSQVIWNTIHGRPFEFTNQGIDWFGPPTRLAVHFEPILLPLSLLYKVWADPRILLIFQTLALAAGALPVFLLARKYLRPWPLLAAFFAIGYLLAPAVLGLNIFDFHPYSLATPFLLFALLALTYQRFAWFILFCILAASCKEDVPLAVAFLGLLVAWRYHAPRLGLALFAGGFLWSGLAFGVIIPHFFPGQQSNNFWYRYEALGSSPQAAVGNLLLHPWLLFTTFITMERLYYVAGLTRNTGFLCWLAPEWLIPTLPSLAVNILSTDSKLYSGVYHYNATIIPFVMLAGIIGARRFIMIWASWRGEPDAIVELIPGQAVLPALPGPIVNLGLRVWRSGVVATLWRWGKNSWRGLLWLVRPGMWRGLWLRCRERLVPLAKRTTIGRLQWVIMAWLTLMVTVNCVSVAPPLNVFWADHDPGTREQRIQQLLAMIPPDASVSASDNINPHVANRQLLTLFPRTSGTIDGSRYAVDYVIVDLNAVFPEGRAHVVDELNYLWSSGQFRVLARAEGVILLQRLGASSGLKSPG